jgi:hypothetical protein
MGLLKCTTLISNLLYQSVAQQRFEQWGVQNSPLSRGHEVPPREAVGRAGEGAGSR